MHSSPPVTHTPHIHSVLDDLQLASCDKTSDYYVAILHTHHIADMFSYCGSFILELYFYFLSS